MTAEDFSYYQLSVPGVFVFCGCMDETHHAPLHASTVDFDEEGHMSISWTDTWSLEEQ